MKKRLFSLLLTVLLCLSLTLPVLADGTGLVRDNAGLLTARAEQELEAELERISRVYDTEVYVVTVETVGSRRMDGYTEDYYDSNFGSGHDGILLLIAMTEREYRILSNGYGAEAVSAGDIDRICGQIEPYLRDGDYAEAFRRFARECEYQLDGARNGFPFALGKNLLISLASGVAAAAVVVLILALQLRSTGRRSTAMEYTRQGSFRLTGSHDIYLYRNVSRRPRQNSSNGGGRSSGGGGGRSMGGGRF